MTPQLSLSGQAAVVTGATGGVARGIAVELARSGATVYLTGRSHAKLDDVVADIAAAGGASVPVLCDHADDSAHYVAALARAYGFSEVDGSQPGLPTYGGVPRHERAMTGIETLETLIAAMRPPTSTRRRR
jgi:NAD(P)-dependent dehydrogenase (short-subunit alcohol dehydrogenase family)